MKIVRSFRRSLKASSTQTGFARKGQAALLAATDKCLSVLSRFCFTTTIIPSSNNGPRPHCRRALHLCHSSILLWCVSTLASQFYLLTRGYCSHVYESVLVLLLCSDACSFVSDAVVIWDWIISLPREYRFVDNSCVFSAALAFLTDLVGLEDSLDSRQNSISLLSVSYSDTLLEFRLILLLFKLLGHHCCPVLALLLRR